MDIIELLKVVLLGVVEGISEWLPISSTGHIILVDEFVKLKMNDSFKEMFDVVIQLGAILAVVILFWEEIFPFSFKKKKKVDVDIFIMWFKVVIASIPAAVVGLLFDDQINELFYNYKSIAIALIFFGIMFIIVENHNKGKVARISTIEDLTYQAVFIIGIFQMIAAVFPGTSRSGATIVGALMIGVSRTVAAEFTFFLAIPAMFGASLLKLKDFGLDFTGEELLFLSVGTLVSLIVSLFVIKFLMSYIKSHNFKVFAWYRIILGSFVLIYFLFLN